MKFKPNQTLFGTFLIEKYESISMTFKVKIFHFYELSEPKKWKLNKVRYFPIGHVQI